MSIFKETFAPEISKQLEARQNLIGKKDRTNQDIVYLNAKTSWVQLRSSVNINTPYTVAPIKLAADNVLFGGLLTDNNNLRHGIGNAQIAAYSNQTYNKSSNTLSDNLLGTRLMPGITNVSIQSKSAYGSLRQATVNFQCWDIKQLEIMEQLYMRPGYTVLLEWGWLPYIDNRGILTDRLYHDDIFFNRRDINIQSYLNELRTISLKSNGNYDSMFGYIMNYNWNYRTDGGYDCMVEIISTGEILESLKINYSGASVSSNDSGTLLSSIQYNNIKDIQKDYRRNILAGLISETYALCLANNKNENSVGIIKYLNNKLGKFGEIEFARLEIELEANEGNSSDVNNTSLNSNNIEGSINDTDSNIYITLGSFISLLNNFVLLENPNAIGDKSITNLRIYDRPTSKNPDGLLTCLYHPLQISVDPRICILRNDLFEKVIQGINITAPKQDNSDIKYIPINSEKKISYRKIIKELIKGKNEGVDQGKIISILNQISTKEDLSGISDTFYEDYNKLFYDFLKEDTINGFGDNSITLFDLNNVFGRLNIVKEDVFYSENDFKKALVGFISYTTNDYIIQGFLDITPEERKKRNIQIQKLKTLEQIEVLDEVKTEINSTSEGYLSLLNKLKSPYYIPDQNPQIALHGNIYINLRLLYNMASSGELENHDSSEKNSINLTSYIKDMMVYIQESIGNINNFELIIEDNVGYIVDINNVPNNDNISPFTFEIGNKNSIIQNISLGSQIFSDQSTIIAVAAQSDAGKLGLENTSMVAYNTGIQDRMISKKDTPINSNITIKDQISDFTLSLLDLKELFDSMNKDMGGIFDSELFTDNIDKYKKSLSDIITFFTSQYKSDNKYKSILPTKLSITTDGIGGLIIGNIFNVNKDFIPQAYKGEKGVGIDLQYLITNIKQNIDSKGKWITIIEANPFIPDNSFNLLTQNQPPFQLNTTFTKTYIYDNTTSSIREDIQSNIQSPSTPPQGIIGDNRAMASALNYTFGSSNGTRGACARGTYHIGEKYILFKSGKDKQVFRGTREGRSGGDAWTEGHRNALTKLGYKSTLIGTNYSKAQMESYLGSRRWNVGEIATYYSNETKNNIPIHYHSQIYTGGMTYDPNINSYILNPNASRWASDNPNNYNSNFVYNGKSQNSYTIYSHILS